jgi:hypothetical protein
MMGSMSRQVLYCPSSSSEMPDPLASRANAALLCSRIRDETLSGRFTCV